MSVYVANNTGQNLIQGFVQCGSWDITFGIARIWSLKLFSNVGHKKYHLHWKKLEDLCGYIDGTVLLDKFSLKRFSNKKYVMSHVTIYTFLSKKKI